MKNNINAGGPHQVSFSRYLLDEFVLLDRDYAYVRSRFTITELAFQEGRACFFYRGHPRFWDFYSTIPVDVFILPYVKVLSEQLRRCLQQQGVRAVF